MGDHLVHIGEVIVNAIVFDPKNGERLRTMDLNNLLQSVQRLFDLLEEREVPYVLVGGIAMLVYVEGRNTQDIDLIVPRDALENLPEIVIEDDNPDFARTRAFKTFHVLGLFDFVVAFTVGTLAAGVVPGLVSGGLTSAPLTVLPLCLIPGFLVPLFTILHLTALLQARQLSRG